MSGRRLFVAVAAVFTCLTPPAPAPARAVCQAGLSSGTDVGPRLPFRKVKPPSRGKFWARGLPGTMPSLCGVLSQKARVPQPLKYLSAPSMTSRRVPLGCAVENNRSRLALQHLEDSNPPPCSREPAPCLGVSRHRPSMLRARCVRALAWTRCPRRVPAYARSASGMSTVHPDLGSGEPWRNRELF